MLPDATEQRRAIADVRTSLSDVGKLQVTMNYTIIVEIHHCVDDLSQDRPCFLVRQTCGWDPLRQVATIDIIHHQRQARALIREELVYPMAPNDGGVVAK